MEKLGVRSGLEVAVSLQLQAAGVTFGYEKLSIPWELIEQKTYRPDFILTNGIIVETKGRFTSADRKKCRIVKAQYPNLDLRFVFSNSLSRISKTSRTTYAMWCRKQGFQFADRLIPVTWLREPKNVLSIRTMKEINGHD